MIKTALTIVLSFLVQAFCTEVSAQARLGSTESEIRKDFSGTSFKIDRTDDGTKYIYYENNEMVVFYYLNDDNECFVTRIIPRQGTLNYLVEKYNKSYVIISDTKWKMYTDNGIVNIDLTFNNGVTIITFSRN